MGFFDTMTGGSGTEEPVVSPEMFSSKEEYRDALKEEHIQRLLEMGGQEIQDYYPEDYNLRIPKTGSWILVRRVVPIAVPIKPLSLYYALPEEKFFKPKYMASIHHAKIVTEDGEVLLRTHEYVLVDDVAQYFEALDMGHARFHYLDNKRGAMLQDERVFYLRSRGLTLQQALQYLMGEITSQHIGYITFHDEYCRSYIRDWDWASYVEKLQKATGETEFESGWTERRGQDDS